MSTEKHIQFLRQHQPLPLHPDDSMLGHFENVRRYFTNILDGRAVPLLLGALGEGDGHGIYLMVETTLHAYPPDVVVSALKDSLLSEHRSVRYWSAQFSAEFPSEELLAPLVDVYKAGSVDERIAVVTAIEVIGTVHAREHLQVFLDTEDEPAVRKMINSALM